MPNAAGIIQRLQRATDKLRGLDYLETVESEDAGLDPTEANRSSASTDYHVRVAVKSLGDLRGSRVLDIGCGKGQAMRTLRSFPFERVDGLELSESLVAIARRNLRGKEQARSSVFQGDARTFDRYGDYDVLYLYNPFPQPVMAQVAPVIAEQTAGQPLTIVYNCVAAEDELLAALPVTHVEDFPSTGTNRIAVYRSSSLPR